MDLLLEGFRQDLKIDKENIEKFYREYIQVNKILGDPVKKYDDILLGYSTEELKFTIGFLTNILKNIEKKKHTVIDSVFDAVEHSGEFKLSVFYGERIIEKFTGNEVEDYLIRIYTLRRMLNALLILDDKLNYLKYLIEFIKQAELFYNQYTGHLKENYKNAMDFYQFMYIYALKYHSDEEKALGYLIKGYNLKKFLIEEKIFKYPEENNIFQIINIVGSYLQIENSFIAMIVDIQEYVEEFVKQITDLKKAAEKKPSILVPYLQNPYKKYVNQFLTNIYILGFDEEYHRVANILPEIISKDHQIIIKINEILTKEEKKEAKLEELQKEIQKAFNNFSKDKKESVLYVYYNALISVFYENKEKISQIEKEILHYRKKLKNAFSLDVPVFRIMNIKGDKEKARKLAKETKEKAVIAGKKFLAKAIDEYIETEFDI